MAIAFNNLLPEWKNNGTPPSDNLKENGFQPGYKPPAAVFNWFWSLVSKSIGELQKSLSTVSDRGLIYDNDTWTMSLSGGGGGSATGGEGSYTLPVATANRLGGVIIGEGLNAEGDGRISPDYDVLDEKYAIDELSEEEVEKVIKAIKGE